MCGRMAVFIEKPQNVTSSSRSSSSSNDKNRNTYILWKKPKLHSKPTHIDTSLKHILVDVRVGVVGWLWVTEGKGEVYGVDNTNRTKI